MTQDLDCYLTFHPGENFLFFVFFVTAFNWNHVNWHHPTEMSFFFSSLLLTRSGQSWDRLPVRGTRTKGTVATLSLQQSVKLCGRPTPLPSFSHFLHLHHKLPLPHSRAPHPPPPPPQRTSRGWEWCRVPPLHLVPHASVRMSACT